MPDVLTPRHLAISADDKSSSVALLQAIASLTRFLFSSGTFQLNPAYLSFLHSSAMM
jgi:hypothetical protein